MCQPIPNPANPTIDLFMAADADGGIGYQTNETVAAQQTNTLVGRFIRRLRPGQSILLNSSQYSNNWAGNYFIWCGVSNGTGGLNLTIADGNGNTLAQTTSYLQITDMKQMYERWTVGDQPGSLPTNTAYRAGEGVTLPFQYGPPTSPNTPYILHVHGFNLALWKKGRFAETAFKRLYWQGYQGRFGAFRWPTTLQTASDLRAFDDSEFNAWESGAPLLNLLTNLNAQYPGNVYLMAHSHGGVVAGEALALAGASQVVNTYAAMQAAVDTHAYDQTTPTRPVSFRTPDRYAQYWTNGAPCYFNGVAGAGTYVNFFNTNDFALSAGFWQYDQNDKPDVDYGYSAASDTFYFHFYGSPTNTPILFPGGTYIIFSYCDQAHSFALGAQPNVGGPFRVGAGYNQVELDVAPYNFTADHIYHSGEYRSDNAQRWQFWRQVLVKMGLRKP